MKPASKAPALVGTLLFLLLGLAWGGAGARASVPGEVAHGCRKALEIIDARVGEAGVRDAEAHPLPGFRYLRANRFLASFGPEIATRDGFEAWMGAMAALDREGRRFELQNLGPAGRAGIEAALAHRLGPGWTTRYVLGNCPDILYAADATDPDARARLIEAADVPDDYLLAARVAGFYPLSAIPIAAGWENWKDENLPVFAVPFGEDGVVQRPIAWRPETESAPLAREQSAALIRLAPLDALGIPTLDPASLRRVAAALAPAFLIDTRSDADRIGHPVWRVDGLPAVDPARPVAFVRQAHARLDGRPVIQLVYTIWFGARPKSGALDLLGGRLDGLIWRITFDTEGRPYVYDTIHACGCYHLFFPAPGVARRPVPEDQASDLREAPTVPMRAPALAGGERMAIRVAASSHYVTGLASDAELPRDVPGGTYRLVVPDVPDARLRAMPLPGGGTRSLFGPDGLVAGTERLERYLLWPMGVVEPGAMRQWGHHATAFVGERHFDDPELFDRAFGR